MFIIYIYIYTNHNNKFFTHPRVNSDLSTSLRRRPSPGTGGWRGTSQTWTLWESHEFPGENHTVKGYGFPGGSAHEPEGERQGTRTGILETEDWDLWSTTSDAYSIFDDGCWCFRNRTIDWKNEIPNGKNLKFGGPGRWSKLGLRNTTTVGSVPHTDRKNSSRNYKFPAIISLLVLKWK